MLVLGIELPAAACCKCVRYVSPAERDWRPAVPSRGHWTVRRFWFLCGSGRARTKFTELKVEVKVHLEEAALRGAPDRAHPTPARDQKLRHHCTLYLIVLMQCRTYLTFYCTYLMYIRGTVP